MADEPIAHWTEVPYRDISGIYSIGVVAFDRAGIQHVLMQVVGTTGPIPQPTVSLNPNSGVWDYHQTFPAGVPTAQYNLAAAAVATDGRFKAVGLLPVNVFSSAPTFTTLYVNADTGVNTPGGGTTAGDPLFTLRFAMEQLAGAGGGGRLYLQDATGVYSLGNTPSPVPVTSARYLNLEAAPGATRANVKINGMVSSGATKLHIKGCTITAPINGASGAVLWVDDCVMLGTGSGVSIGASGWFPTWTSVYGTDTDVTTCATGFRNMKLSRGCTATNIGGYAWRMDTGQAVIDCSGQTLTSGIGFIDTGAVDNALVFNTSILDVASGGKGLDIHCATLQTYTNCAFVNLLAEAGVGVADENQVRDVSPDHFLLWNCTLPNKRFAWRCTPPLRLSVEQTEFLNQISGAGDLVGAPTVPDSAFDHCHYELGTGLLLGSNFTVGDPDFTAAGTNDYTPATGSPLYDDHLAPIRVRCDQEKQPRSDPTTVGALKGADEGGGGGGGDPDSLTYSPIPVFGEVGSAIPTLTPSYQGFIETFEVAPSLYHLYKAPPEIVCTAAMAHFEVRAWAPGDPTDPLVNPPTGHWNRVVEDLRNGHVYLKNPKSSGTAAFDALSTAGNLCAPFAMDGGAVAQGPWPGERPVIRYRGTALGGASFFSGTSDITIWGGDSSGNPASHNVAWAGQAGFGGFYPLTGAWQGKGQQIVVSVIGASGGKTDKIIGPQEMGRGLKKTDGTYDLTTCARDVLYKDLLFSPNDQVFGVGGTTGQCIQAGGKDGMTGRIRLYDYGFWFFNPFASMSPPGWGSKQLIEFGAGAHFDFRRGVYPAVAEHGQYIHQLNAGIFRDATASSGETADSWFIDLSQPGGSGRSLIQFQDRPYNHTPSGDPMIVNPATMLAPKGGTGVVLVERCSSDTGTDGTSKFTFQGGCDLTYILRDCSVEQLGAEGVAQPKPDGTFGQFGSSTRHARGILIFGWYASGDKSFVGGGQASSVRINSNGYMVKRAVIINYNDFTDNPSEKRMTFRGCEEVHIYGFDCKNSQGGPRPVIGLDEEDSNPVAWYQLNALEQITNEGVIAYTQHGVPSGSSVIGTPISLHGNKHPPNGNIYLYTNYPNPISEYAGWFPNPAGTNPDPKKVVRCTFPTPGAFQPLTDQQINVQLRGVPAYLPTDLILNPTTGIITGTPSQGIGVQPGVVPGAGAVSGELITSPFTYVTDAAGVATTGAARVFIKGSNPSSADSYTGGSFPMLIAPGADIGTFVSAPTAVVSVYAIPPSDIVVDKNILNPGPAIVRVYAPTTNLQVDQQGDTITVRPPPAIVRVFTQTPDVEHTTEVAAPTAIVRVYAVVAALTVTGASDATDGPAALVGLRAGFQAMKGVS